MVDASERFGALMDAIFDAAEQNQIDNDELVDMISAALGRIVVHVSEGEPDQLQDLIDRALRQFGDAIKATATDEFFN